MFIWVLIYWTALAKAQQLLLNDQERDYILTQVHAAKREILLLILDFTYFMGYPPPQFRETYVYILC